MSDSYISEIKASDSYQKEQLFHLLSEAGIRLDSHLDYTCGLFNEEGELLATGSCYANTLRCLCVAPSHQGEGLMNQIVSHLIRIQFELGNSHLFLYTKCTSADFFAGLGFHEILRIKDQIVFMENRSSGFHSYLHQLLEETTAFSCPPSAKATAIVMNANPFTLGHQFLVETAAAENDLVHLFLLREENPLIPFSVRKNLVQQGISHLKNVILHDTGSYMISQATFPGYFQKDADAVIESQANLDLELFLQIAQTLHISSRYVGEEPFSHTTAIYNRIMKAKLTADHISCHVIPRKKVKDTFISASLVRQQLKKGDSSLIKEMVPPSTYDFFCSSAGQTIIRSLQNCPDVFHH